LTSKKVNLLLAGKPPDKLSQKEERNLLTGSKHGWSFPAFVAGAGLASDSALPCSLLQLCGKIHFIIK
jgi:hypothetical protein